MKPAPFIYHAPKTLEQAVAVLAEVAPEDGRVLAGGQSLVPTMAFRLARPAHLVDINQVAGLDRLAVENGGQSLVPTMAFRLARPAHLVDINQVAGLDRLAVENDALAIGACVRHAAFHRPVAAGPLGDLLAFVVRHIAHYPIRTRGTFCGSLAHADPASEWCLVAATLGGEIAAKSARGTRKIAAADFFQGLMATALGRFAPAGSRGRHALGIL